MVFWTIMGQEPQATYTARTPRSRNLFAEAQEVLVGGLDSNFRVVRPYPFFVERAQGARVWDVDGNAYLDFLLGQGSMIHGHGHPAIRGALESQLATADLTTLASELPILLGREVKRRMPSVERLRYTASGTEATMHAVRLARAFTHRPAVAKAEGAYHGGNDSLLWSVYGHTDMPGPAAAPAAQPFSLGLPPGLGDHVVVFQFNDLEATEAVLRKNAHRLAAVIVEPIMGNAGVIPPRDGYLHDLAKICRELGLVLILDEVMTGFRVAPGGAQDLYGVRPDLTTMGKIIGGGLPQGAVGGSREIMELTGPGEPQKHSFHGGTNAGHPLAMAAGREALRLLDDGAYGHLRSLGDRLFRGIQDAADDAGVGARVHHVGPLGHVHFTQGDIVTGRDGLEKGDWRALERWCMACAVDGSLLGHPHGEKIFLSTVHTAGDVDEALGAATKALALVAS